METIINILPLILIPTFVTIGAGIVASFYDASKNLQSVILHFAAGVVFSVISVEIIPDIIKIHKPLYIVLGFCLGIVTMLTIKHLLDRDEGEKESDSPKKFSFGMVSGVAVDLGIDGFILGIGFAAGQAQGTLLAIALTFELLSLGLATASNLKANGLKRSKNIRIIVLLAALFMFCAILGATLLNHLPDTWQEVVLSFGLAALLFLVTEELLVEAHEEKEKPYHTAVFFLGYLIFLIIGII
ncbi:MAG: transporter [Bacteroidota bacterium]|nr:transporter [Bacteroidota bacterium]